MKQIITIISISLVFLTLLSSCVKEDFDTVPEKEYSTDIDANATIAQIKDLFTTNPTAIDTNLYVKAYIISSDSAGNFYKKMVAQDTSGGIEIHINDYDLYRKYPIGAEVLIKCQDLRMEDYNGIKQLKFWSNGELASIPADRTDSIVMRTGKVIDLQPQVLQISELKDKHISTFVRLEGVEFIAADTSKTFASENLPENRTLTDFFDNTIILRTSNYAEFALDSIPKGNGNIDAIYNVFRSTKQLVINDPDDIKFNNPRIEKDIVFEEDFDTDLGDFIAYDVAGQADWYQNEHAGTTFAAISGYNQGANEDWLISPALDLTEYEQLILAFTHAVGYLSTWDDMSVWIADDYTEGEDPNDSGTWTEITGYVQPDPGSSNWSSFENSGGIDISDYAGSNNVRIAFKYTCTTSDATTWEIDRVIVTAQ